MKARALIMRVWVRDGVMLCKLTYPDGSATTYALL